MIKNPIYVDADRYQLLLESPLTSNNYEFVGYAQL